MPDLDETMPNRLRFRPTVRREQGTMGSSLSPASCLVRRRHRRQTNQLSRSVEPPQASSCTDQRQLVSLPLFRGSMSKAPKTPDPSDSSCFTILAWKRGVGGARIRDPCPTNAGVSRPEDWAAAPIRSAPHAKTCCPFWKGCRPRKLAL